MAPRSSRRVGNFLTLLMEPERLFAAATALADALVRYGSADLDATSFERRNGHVALVTPVIDAWPLEAPTRRAERAFGLSLDVGVFDRGA